MLAFLAAAAPIGESDGSGSVTLLVIFITLAIGVSFLCSIMEAVLLSVSPAYIGALEADNPTAAARLRELKSDVDRPLAAILTLNTVAHTIGAAGAGAEAAAVFHQLWIDSPGHYRNMTNETYVTSGIGLYKTDNGWYGTHVFGF